MTAATLPQFPEAPREEKLSVIDTLEVFLSEEQPPCFFDTDWQATISRRLQEVQQNEAAMVPASEVFAKARLILKR